MMERVFYRWRNFRHTFHELKQTKCAWAQVDDIGRSGQGEVSLKSRATTEL